MDIYEAINKASEWMHSLNISTLDVQFITIIGIFALLCLIPTLKYAIVVLDETEETKIRKL